MRLTIVIPMLALAIASSALAHESRPAYLELRQTEEAEYDVLWKVPGRGEDMRLGLYVEWPDGCRDVSVPRAQMVNNAFVERWRIACDGGLSGKTVRIAGLSGTQTDALVRLERLDGTSQLSRLTPTSTSFVVSATPNAWDVVSTYTVLGIGHLLTGIDHLLFVLALLIITRGGWKLVKTVTAFTISHCITLSLATLGYVNMPSAPVEAIIALSIVFVAAEIVRAREGRPGLTQRAPWTVAFAFGLMHGLGFAGGLSEMGLPPGHVPTALLFFSLGVEAGHLIFVGVMLALIWAVRRLRLAIPDWVSLAPPYAIGSVAAFWVIQRVLLF